MQRTVEISNVFWPREIIGLKLTRHWIMQLNLGQRFIIWNTVGDTHRLIV